MSQVLNTVYNHQVNIYCQIINALPVFVLSEENSHKSTFNEAKAQNNSHCPFHLIIASKRFMHLYTIMEVA